MWELAMSSVDSSALVYAKKYVENGEVVVAICDQELIGTKIVDKAKKIAIYVDPAFYKGELLTIERALKLLSEATIANLIGKNIVEAAIERGYVLRDSVIDIGGVPHVQLIGLGEGANIEILR